MGPSLTRDQTSMSSALAEDSLTRESPGKPCEWALDWTNIFSLRLFQEDLASRPSSLGINAQCRCLASHSDPCQLWTYFLDPPIPGTLPLLLKWMNLVLLLIPTLGIHGVVEGKPLNISTSLKPVKEIRLILQVLAPTLSFKEGLEVISKNLPSPSNL